MSYALPICACGCGEPVTRPENRFRKSHHLRKAWTSLNHGYVKVWLPEHPRAISGYVYEHVVVVERAISRQILPPIVVHHVDRVRTNNQPSNLCVLQDSGEHARLHARLRVLRAGGNPWTEKLCAMCRLPKPFAAFYNAKRSDCIECCRADMQRRRALLKETA